jgi:hypothetical protein
VAARAAAVAAAAAAAALLLAARLLRGRGVRRAAAALKINGRAPYILYDHLRKNHFFPLFFNKNKG